MDLENVFRWTGVVLTLFAFSISIYYRSRAARRGRESGDQIDETQEGRIFVVVRKLGGLVLWVSALLYLINPAWMAWAQLDLPAWLRWIGAGIMLVCLPLVYWLFSSLGNNVTTTVVTRKEHQLVTTGPYRYVRHPLYSVGFMLYMALGLLAANWFILLVALLAFALISRRTPLEEQRLIERFGDEYRTYMQRTGRYFPRLG